MVEPCAKCEPKKCFDTVKWGAAVRDSARERGETGRKWLQRKGGGPAVKQVFGLYEGWGRGRRGVEREGLLWPRPPGWSEAAAGNGNVV